MSTTFYIEKGFPTELQEQFDELLKERNLWRVQEFLNKNLQAFEIGTRSCGWQFGFLNHRWKFFKNIEELKEWLKDGQIVDEYGRKFTFDEFWNDEIGDFLYKGHNHTSYLKEHPDESWRPWDAIIDGYRFLID